MKQPKTLTPEQMTERLVDIWGHQFDTWDDHDKRENFVDLVKMCAGLMTDERRAKWIVDSAWAIKPKRSTYSHHADAASGIDRHEC